jgi:chorismate mutase
VDRLAEPRVRAIRGATTARANTAAAILEATRELVVALQEANGFEPDDIVSAIFTATPDLTAAFPATAAREAGWRVPLLDAVEMDVPGAPPMCVRALVQVYTERRPDELHHVYLHGAARLRPDLA